MLDSIADQVAEAACSEGYATMIANLIYSMAHQEEGPWRAPSSGCPVGTSVQAFSWFLIDAGELSPIGGTLPKNLAWPS